ncbi:Hsc70-interacting protein, putative [Perkinsus marinus ATCC 50983]|uniref:Hsc70-interacting protein, putative n=1 Tax=Perkinsus marinus (strain ATCC 50983 / TXsc) TaxID=423536 RepID=C5K7M2_PERM5|nr:Hsc70-interacting protein, putative [Perkinsus marinus ATCC 50983]EER19557.1 Hsc70-interacting protein, putative [Perkinsus marinus ATCC 50983]|eukprot:XP_002787761.1 Hsc70-interacting protein, putative [Perkinsus marinus ATCC 50983]
MTATSLEGLGQSRENLADIKLEEIDFEAVDKCTSAAKLGRYITLLEADGGYYRELLAKAKEKLLRIDKKAYYKCDDSVGTRKACPIREVRSCDEGDSISAEMTAGDSVDMRSGDGEPRNPYARDMTAMKDYYRAWDRFDVEAACDAVDVKVTNTEESVAPAEAPLAIDQSLSSERVEAMSAAERHDMCEAEKIKGNESFASGDLDEAELHYTRALRLRSDVSVLWSNRALVRLKLRRPREGLEDAQRAIALDPKNVKAFHRRGKARAELDYLEEAVKDFQTALKILNDSGAEQGMIGRVNADLATARRKLIYKQRAQVKEEIEAPKIQEIFDESPVV